MTAIGERVTNGVKLEHSVAGYLCFARDREQALSHGSSRLIQDESGVFHFRCNLERAAMIAVMWKQFGQKSRLWWMNTGSSTRATSPLRMFPLQIQVLLDALYQDNQVWCTEDYSTDEDINNDYENALRYDLEYSNYISEASIPEEMPEESPQAHDDNTDDMEENIERLREMNHVVQNNLNLNQEVGVIQRPVMRLVRRELVSASRSTRGSTSRSAHAAALEVTTAAG